MPVDPLTATLEKELASIAIKGAGSIIDRAWKWYGSYDLLILGQERAGKTAFYKFLRSKLLSKNGEKTSKTIDPVNSGVFQFEWSTDAGSLALELRNVGDRSGQIGPDLQSQMLIGKKPHLLVVVLDLTAVPHDDNDADRVHATYETWFEHFCTSISDRLMNRPRLARKVSGRLRNMVILLNKADKIEADARDESVAVATAQIRAILKTRLSHYFGGRVRHLSNSPVFYCFKSPTRHRGRHNN